MLPTSARWIQDFEKHLYRRQHLILYGNIHDQFLWQSHYKNITSFLNSYFISLGFDVIVRYDPIDGLTFPQPEMRQTFDNLTQQGIIEKQLDINLSPTKAFSKFRTVISQTKTSVVAIADLGDMLTSDPEHYLPEERYLLMLLKKSTLEASVITEGNLNGYRNTIIILASDLKRVPRWFYANNPFVTLVKVSHPNKEERLKFILRFGQQGFYGGNQINIQRPTRQQPSELEMVAEEFATLTAGLQTIDLEAIRITSWRERIPLGIKTINRLIDFYKFGQRDEPLEKINPDKITLFKENLSKDISGQPAAIEAITTLLTSSKVGISLNKTNENNSKPKGVFFFLGSIGVGKTELAKSLTKLLFDNEQSYSRFDMSEYQEADTVKKLLGSSSGIIGYEEGGQLTNCILEHPYSILLFDQIEKAHPQILDQLLQVLENGRLTDAKGQTVYFNQTIIIFSSNLGTMDLIDIQTGGIIRHGIFSKIQNENINYFTYQQVKNHFLNEVYWYFNNRIGRTEFLNFLHKNIIVFDFLRADCIWQIGQKFLQNLAESALDKYQLQLFFQPTILDVLNLKMQEGDNLLFGGRRIKTLLETLVEYPLNRWIFTNYSDFNLLAGKRLIISLESNGLLLVGEG